MTTKHLETNAVVVEEHTERLPGESLGDFLNGDLALSAEDRRTIDQAWNHLFARAARGSLGPSDAGESLADLGRPWANLDHGLLFALFLRSCDQIASLSEAGAETASTGAADHAMQAARLVQASVAELYTAVVLPRIAPRVAA